MGGQGRVPCPPMCLGRATAAGPLFQIFEAALLGIHGSQALEMQGE